MVRISVACRSLAAHNAPRTAAIAGLLRGTPVSSTSSACHRRVSLRSTRPRRRRRMRAPFGTETRIVSAVKFFRPVATRAEAPSRNARGPPSSTAAHHCASGGSGPWCVAIAWPPTRRHRRARTCALTSPRANPRAYTWERDTMPAWLAARARTAAIRSSRACRSWPMGQGWPSLCQLRRLHAVLCAHCCLSEGACTQNGHPYASGNVLRCGRHEHRSAGRHTERPATWPLRQPLRRTPHGTSCNLVAPAATPQDVRQAGRQTPSSITRFAWSTSGRKPSRS